MAQLTEVPSAKHADVQLPATHVAWLGELQAQRKNHRVRKCHARLHEVGAAKKTTCKG